MGAQLKDTKSLHKEKIESLLHQANSIIVDKSVEISLCVSCFLANGHLLLEDRPGMGKTTLIKTLSLLFGLNSNRIQFTNDMLPADILGASIFNQQSNSFEFHKGPIFSNFILADEINRATPKTQSAFLQGMEEGIISIDGKSYQLPKPFFIAATQNPTESIGTFNLPESQLDRFLMKISLGYPSREAERALLKKERTNLMNKLKPVFSSQEIIEIQNWVSEIHLSETLLDYAQDLIEKSRTLTEGLSPRAAKDFVRASQAWAFIEGRDFVIPEDLQRVAHPVMGHRLGKDAHLVDEIIQSVRVP